MGTKIKASEKLYFKYEYLAKKYAGRIYSYEELSYEYEDLLQEFKIKIFTSVKAYGRRWSKFRKGTASRPVPLRYYLEAACSNKQRDFMKYISRENHKLRIDEIDYDFGVSSETNIEPESNKFIVNGIDLLEGLLGKERLIFSLFLRGYNKTFLTKVYFSNDKEKALKKEIIANGDEPFEVTDIIEMQKARLIKRYGGDLQRINQRFETYSFED